MSEYCNPTIYQVRWYTRLGLLLWSDWRLEETKQNIATDLIPMAEQNFLTLKLELQKEFGYFHGVLQQLSNVACWRPLRKYYDYGASFNYR